MLNPLKFLPMILEQRGSQKLDRVPEPDDINVTNADDDVAQYGKVMSTKLVVAYAVGLETIYRARSEIRGRNTEAIDLACGPGRYTFCLKKYLGYDRVVGVDLAPNMIKIAAANAQQQGLNGNVAFELGDITNLQQFGSDTFDLSSFTDAAHHMPNLATVQKVLIEMDRITRPDGLVMLMDLARLRTASLTEKYVNLLGADYKDRGLAEFFRQFHDSMYAAWTYDELESVIPRNSRRVWCHVVSKVLPTMQIVFGLPVGRSSLFMRKGVPWLPQDSPVPADHRADWMFARLTLLSAPPKVIPAGKVAA